MHPPIEKSPAITELHGVKHGFFGRKGGVSEGEFASLNASRAVGDDHANVVENVHRAVMALKAGPLPIAMGRQIHSTIVHTVTKDFDIKNPPDADALVTSEKGIALGVLTADCVPVLLADAAAGVIGAAHAGWKGAVGGIVEKTVEAMTALGAMPANITLAIGSSISVGNYEIGTEMANDIRDRFPHAERFIKTEGFAKPHFDVPGLVLDQAKALGLAAVEQVGLCTYANPELYWSHRYATHNSIRAGRQIALIALS